MLSAAAPSCAHCQIVPAAVRDNASGEMRCKRCVLHDQRSKYLPPHITPAEAHLEELAIGAFISPTAELTQPFALARSSAFNHVSAQTGLDMKQINAMLQPLRASLRVHSDNCPLTPPIPERYVNQDQYIQLMSNVAQLHIAQKLSAEQSAHLVHAMLLHCGYPIQAHPYAEYAFAPYDVEKEGPAVHMEPVRFADAEPVNSMLVDADGGAVDDVGIRLGKFSITGPSFSRVKDLARMLTTVIVNKLRAQQDLEIALKAWAMEVSAQVRSNPFIYKNPEVASEALTSLFLGVFVVDQKQKTYKAGSKGLEKFEASAARTEVGPSQVFLKLMEFASEHLGKQQVMGTKKSVKFTIELQKKGAALFDKMMRMMSASLLYGAEAKTHVSTMLVLLGFYVIRNLPRQREMASMFYHTYKAWADANGIRKVVALPEAAV